MLLSLQIHQRRFTFLRVTPRKFRKAEKPSVRAVGFGWSAEKTVPRYLKWVRAASISASDVAEVRLYSWIRMRGS